MKVMKMSSLFNELRNKMKHYSCKIVFPEGADERILSAAVRLHNEGIISPVLLGEEGSIHEVATNLGLNIEGIEIMNPQVSELLEQMIPLFVAKRKGKVNEEEARGTLLDTNYFGTMLVEMNVVQGLVSGAIHSTADTVRPALQIIKTKPGITKTSGVIILINEQLRYVFADCAININPNCEELAEIGIETARTALTFGIEPRLAMLSFSSHGSAKTDETIKVSKATAMIRERMPHFVVDGEIQLDAAIVPTVSQLKTPNSPLKGNANVFVFPNLDAGNIGYKMAQRLGGLEAVGPILQGLNKPINDLSRGCSVDEVYGVALITAWQGMHVLR